MTLDWLFGGCCGPGGTLVWTTEAWIVAVAAVGVVLAIVLAALPRPRGGARVAEIGLLAAAGAVLLFAVAGPVWVQEGDRVEPGRYVALVDASRSMQVLDGDGTPRSDKVAARLARLPGAEIYSFGDSLRPGAPTAYDLGDTDLGGALAAIGQRYAGEKLEGLAVITDGIDRGGLRRRVLGEADAVLPRLNGPLTIYQVGEDGGRTDIAVSDVRAGGFAFLRAPFAIEVDVRAVGTSARTLPVTLTRDGQPAGTKTVTLDAEGRGTARFEITPEAVGRFIYEAATPVTDGDAVPANNALSLAVRVVRDRVRVLQVCGSPSFDQKFLRLFLKEDPAVDLVSFFILRTDRDMGAGWDSSELSLIQFPYEKLFSSELWSFDLVIFQNFDYRPYFANNADELLGNIARYVKENGKAFVMMGGDRSFDLGAYAGTPIADILPVQLGVTGEALDADPFTPRLTDGGARHPVTQLVGDPSENSRIWSGLSALDGLNLSRGASQGAAVLLEHPSLKGADGKALPVLAVGEYGAGRSMALLGDSSWRWSFAEAGEGRGNQAYLRFWKNAARWLIGDPEDQPVVVEANRDNYQIGEEVRITTRVRNVSFAAVVDAKVDVTIDGPGGRQTLQGRTGADGSVALALPAADRGAHRVKVVARGAGGQTVGQAQTAYAVTTRDPELEEVEPDSTFLRTLAARTGGLYVAPGEQVDPLRNPEAGRRVRDRAETPLYAAPLVPLAFGLLVSLSWWIRRRVGYR
ncbi:MAG: glutamine amidotransferase [Pseudomonadota bacterium]|nr:glutamine amidotransferase [Pseudomonadota bacterium]